MRPPNVPDELRAAPFTAAHAARYGLTRRALGGDEWRNIFRGVWAHKDLPDNRETRFAAVRLILPDGAFVCGLTPAWLYGIDVQDPRGDLMWIGCRTGHSIRVRAGCMVREITVADSDVRIVRGVPMTTPLRTAFDCGRWLSLIEGTVVADFLAHAGAMSCDALAAYARTHRALRGVRQLDRIVELMDARSESPMETRVRLLIVLAGLPPPEPQVIITNRDGDFVARADLGYEAERYAVEYDGAWHWKQRREDDRRRAAMRDAGWEVLVVSSEDYYDHPDWIIAKVRADLANRAT
jgi:hypothetical protein